MSLRNDRPYPPIVDTWQPAVILGDNLRIYFNLSVYSELSEIEEDAVQVSVVSQETNVSVVKSNMNHGSEYLFSSMETDDQGRYYVDVGNLLLDLQTDGLYKVQLRFFKTSLLGLPLDNGGVITIRHLRMFPNSYADYASEWSDVTLIRVISTPRLSLNHFQGMDNYKTAILSTSSLNVYGTLSFSNEHSSEFLKEYTIKLYQGKEKGSTVMGKKIVDSGTIYGDPFTINCFNYAITRNLEDQYYYTLQINYITSSGYFGSQDFHFLVNLNNVLNPGQGLWVKTEMDKIDASIKITITQDSFECLCMCCDGDAYLLLRRASSLDNYTSWEDFKYFKCPHSFPVTFSTVDRTVEAGVLYKYDIIPVDSRGYRGVRIWPKESDIHRPIMCDFNDTRLVATDEIQYNLKHDPQVSNFKYTVVESKTDTLGGQFPFIRRNGDTYYRQFSLSGLITHFNENDYPDEYLASNLFKNGNFTNGQKPLDSLEDKRQQFLTDVQMDLPVTDEELSEIKQQIKEDYDNEYYKRYENPNRIFDSPFAEKQHRIITPYDDIYLEKEYREYSMDFLYKNRILLFRSPTEGNILIKLMDISLSPKQADRYTYNFSATAYEIDKNILDNIVKYNIHKTDIPTFINTDSVETGYAIGQLRVNQENQENQDNTAIAKIPVYDLINIHLKNKESNYLGLKSLKWIKYNFLPWGPSNWVSTLDSNNEEQETNGLDRENVVEYRTPAQGWVNEDLIIDANVIDISTTPIVEIQDADDERNRAFYEVQIRFIGEDDPLYGIFPKNSTDTEKVILSAQWAMAGYYFDQMRQSSPNGTDDQIYYSKDKDGKYRLHEKSIEILSSISPVGYSWLSNQLALAILSYSVGLEDEEEIRQQVEINLGDEYAHSTHVLFTEILFGEDYLNLTADQIDSNVAVKFQAAALNTLNFTTAPWNPLDEPLIFRAIKAIALYIYDGLKTPDIIDIDYGDVTDENYSEEIKDENVVGGYLITMNNHKIVVPQNGYYELNTDDVSIKETTIIKPKTTELYTTVDYIAEFARLPQDLIAQKKSTLYYYKIGQYRAKTGNEYWNAFSNDSLTVIEDDDNNVWIDVTQEIKEKYENKNKNSLSESQYEYQYIKYLSIEAQPYTKIKVWDAGDGYATEQKEFEINETGILTLYDEGTHIIRVLVKIWGSDIEDVRDRNIRGLIYDEDEEEFKYAGELMYGEDSAFSDFFVNYICYLKEDVY